MLRNSTKKFKQKYEDRHIDLYRSIGDVTPFREDTGRGLGEKGRGNASQRLKTQKIEQNLQNKTMSIRVKPKESLQLSRNNKLESTKTTHRRQLTSPVSKKQTDNDSVASISSIKWRHKNSSSIDRDPEEFIAHLPKNSVFYCCECFQYIFQIQKKRHYPDCKDRLDLSCREENGFRKICWERLERIMELSKYTNTNAWQIDQLSKQMFTLQFCKIFSVNYPNNARFFTLQQIIPAFVYTYQHLLKGKLFKGSSLFCF